MEGLHKGAKWLFRSQMYVILIFLFIFLILPFGLTISKGAFGFILPSLIVLIIIAVVGEIFVRWSYKNWKYEFAKDSLRIEKGVIVKRYKSVPYARVQNVDITRGIIARIIGFSTIDIQTAGYSAYSSQRGMGISEGHIPAVSIKEAEKIRSLLMKKISGKKQGL
jgi:membrane protein YdbS with pleckstrin-like domain